jgi:hypothetical protein
MNFIAGDIGGIVGCGLLWMTSEEHPGIVVWSDKESTLAHETL